MLRFYWKTIGFTVFSLKNVKKTSGFTVCSLKNVKKPLVLLCVRSKMLKNRCFYCVFAQKCWKTIGFTVCSLKNVEKALVLLYFRSKMYLKNSGVTMFSLNNVEKTMVFLCFRSKILKNHRCYCVFAQKCQKAYGFTSKEALKPKIPLVLL